eukprot:TRINITY_DN1968_c0_g2_i1.p2 TRINITY_DN1968_c0_g2~~TRINITY_DN1968_c0_g2_i1.p2  ORF type:complete len:129 (-),score=10.78 TRINITY_DN1968_c0_g2_i1:940-1326(-)
MMHSCLQFSQQVCGFCKQRSQQRNYVSVIKKVSNLEILRYRKKLPQRKSVVVDAIEMQAVDAAPEWTLDQIAGLFIGVLLMLSIFLAGFVDRLIAKAERSQLGLCQECGGLFDPINCPKLQCPYKQTP